MNKCETIDLVGSRSASGQWCLGIHLRVVPGTKEQHSRWENKPESLRKPVPEW